LGTNRRSVRIAVYTIALNEEQFVERWYNSAKDADYLLIADTGSTDNTVAKAKELGINVIEIGVNPWRFDDARTASLAALPKDIDMCIQLDMDEILVGNYREEIQKAWEQGANRVGYWYISSWTPDKKPNIQFEGFKCHSRIGYRWKYPIHEVVVPYGILEKKIRGNFEIHHLADSTKDRNGYLSMLELAVEENPDARNLSYLGREYFFKNRYDEAKDTLHKYLKVGVWPAERSYVYRLLSKVEPDQAEEHLLKAAREWPCREALMSLANYYYQKNMWIQCLEFSKKALEVTDKNNSFFNEAWAWSHMGADLAALSAYSLELWDQAYKYGKLAAEQAPEIDRLQNNLKFYREKVNEHNTKPDDR